MEQAEPEITGGGHGQRRSRRRRRSGGLRRQRTSSMLVQLPHDMLQQQGQQQQASTVTDANLRRACACATIVFAWRRCVNRCFRSLSERVCSSVRVRVRVCVRVRVYVHVSALKRPVLVCPVLKVSGPGSHAACKSPCCWFLFHRCVPLCACLVHHCRFKLRRVRPALHTLHLTKLSKQVASGRQPFFRTNAAPSVSASAAALRSSQMFAALVRPQVGGCGGDTHAYACTRARACHRVIQRTFTTKHARARAHTHTHTRKAFWTSSCSSTAPSTWPQGSSTGPSWKRATAKRGSSR